MNHDSHSVKYENEGMQAPFKNLTAGSELTETMVY